MLVTALVAGQLIYNLHCFQCHGESGMGMIGPNIQNSSWQRIYKKAVWGIPAGTMPIINISSKEAKEIEFYLTSRKK